VKRREREREREREKEKCGNQTFKLSSACLQSVSGAFFEVGGALKLLSMRGLGAWHEKEIPES